MLRSSLSLGAAALLVFAANAAWAADGVAPAKESVPGGPLMLAAYMFIWLFPIILLWRSHKQAASLEAQIAELRDLIKKAEAKIDS